GAGEGVGGDIDLCFAWGGSECHAVCDVPEGVFGCGCEQKPVRVAGGFKGYDLSLVPVGPALGGEVACIGSDIEDEVDIEAGEEKTVAKSAGGIDTDRLNLVAGGSGD